MIQARLKLDSGWGGRREGAGRKSSPDSGVPHLRREKFGRHHPCHITLRVRDEVPSLRTVKLVRELERSFAQACERGDFRLVHYSIQSNHAHLIVEAAGPSALGRGMNSIAARLARAVNRVFDRSGPVLADRYHMRPLRTPREVRNALAYVLLNARRHARRLTRKAAKPDPASSGRWFQGWKDWLGIEEDRPTVEAHTWLLREGWRRYGRLSLAEVPGG